MHTDALVDRRMERLSIFRLLLLLGAVLLAALYRTGLPASAREVSAWFFASVLGGYGISVFLPLGCPRRLLRSRFLVGALIAVDVGVETLLIWTTGGVAGIFAPLTFATVFCATTVLGLRGSLATAAGATGGIALANALWSLGWFPPQALGIFRIATGPSSLATLAHILAYGMALHAVALLSAGLAGGLQAMRIVTAEILQKLAEGLIAVDGRGRIICVNDEARKLLRHSEFEMLEGRALEAVLRRTTDARIRALLQAGEDRRMELLLEGRDGRVRPIEAKISVLRGPDGGIRSTIGIFSDLTLRKEAERASRRIEKLEELGEMALAIAHEIRNPLASIRGCAQEIARTAPSDGVIPRLVAILCRESDRLDASIDEFLNLSR
ncbi:MAG: PAS domain-containing protein, partial [Planctomycetes bacterium]|nr:PAS domain-containing protein [Planctomycetota bacterium]